MKATKRNQLRSLLAQHAYKKLDMPVRLASGEMSSHYVDCAPILLSYTGRKLAAQLVEMTSALKFDPFDVIAGDDGVFPLVVEVARRMGLETLRVRRDGTLEESYRSRALQQGNAALKVLVLEDVLTTGTSVLKVVHAVRMSIPPGFSVRHVISLVDRSQDFKALNIDYAYIYTMEEIGRYQERCFQPGPPP